MDFDSIACSSLDILCVTETTAEQAYVDVLRDVGANIPHHDA